MGLPLADPKKPINTGDLLAAGLSGAAGFFANQPVNTSQSGNTVGHSSGGSSGSTNTTGNSTDTSSGQSVTNTSGSTNQYGTNSQSQVGSTSSTPSFQMGGQPLLAALTQQYLNLANTAPDINGFTASSIRQINDASAARSNSIRSALASRGLGYSPAGVFGQIASDNQRSSEVSNLRSQVPLMAQKLLSSNLGDASNFLNSAYRGTEGSTVGQATGSQQQQSQNQSTSSTEQFTNFIRSWIQNALQNSNFEQDSTGQTSQQGQSGSSGSGVGGILAALAPFAKILLGGV